MKFQRIKDDGKTAVYQESDYKFNAPHHFLVIKADEKAEDEIADGYFPEAKFVLNQVNFQEGPIKEAGINGVTNEDLIHMVMARLEGFQKSEFSCRENALALTKLEEALMWLNRRTQKRIERGVEGLNVK